LGCKNAKLFLTEPLPCLLLKLQSCFIKLTPFGRAVKLLSFPAKSYGTIIAY
jgi:hypothetical protein